MEMNNGKIDFSFGWLALKLLGKSLYSNAWSAISELVANGFDANARNVYVYINNAQKDDSTIEIIDDGKGMDEDGIKTYVRVGFNKREVKSDISDDYLLMGRKGIGKLAALYLSEEYIILSKTDHSSSKWEMTYRENTTNEDEHPYLNRIYRDISPASIETWNTCDTGTLIQMNHVNLSGLGDVAIEALSKKLSNYFALDSMETRNIYLCVVSNSSSKPKFRRIEKEIAFRNMAFIEYCLPSNAALYDIVTNCSNNIIEFPYPKLNGKQTYKHEVEVEDLNNIDGIGVTGEIECVNIDGNLVKKEYKLYGWIGLHSTIDERLAEKNDSSFTRNKYYNPNQLRLYVRNKLAMENFLTVLNNTQAFVNYIEGEIHFDILDEDDLPDIATSNRQGLDEHDSRVLLLVGIIKNAINHLINKRNALNDRIKECQESLLVKQADNAKKQFAKEVEHEVDSFDSLSDVQKSTLTSVVTNKIKGNVTPKNDYILFISHSRKDKIITDFIYHLLKKKGAKDHEFFYTSRDDNVDQFQNIDSLATQIKNNIVKDNVLLLYLTSKSYKESEFCMFEGGAGWATKSVGDYIALSLTYQELPQFITNGKLEFTFERNKEILLDRQTYMFLIRMFNKIIEHLNSGRRANNESEITPFTENILPTDIELSHSGNNLVDYMDQDLVEHWNFYISNNIDEYMSARYPVTSKLT